MVNAFPSSVHQSGLDLANRNILWTSAASAGIKIPLPFPFPIDLCCSISLVSKKHADLVSQNCLDLKFTKLATPLSVSVASAESKFQAVSMMQIPLVWENGGGGGGGGTICTPFFLQTTFAFTQASFTVTPAPSITPSPNKKFGRGLDFAWTLFSINFNLQLLKVKRH